MDRRRIDLAVGLVVATALHGLVLAAASRVLRPSESFAAVQADPPLEVVLIDEEAWRAQLEDVQPARSAEPLEAPVVHTPAELPDWPELEVAREADAVDPLVVRAADSPIEPDPRRSPRPRERVEAQPLVPRVETPAEEVPAPADPAPSESPGPVTIEGSSALVLHRPTLHYPSRPHRRGIEGTVRVGLEVDEAGRVARTWVIRSSGNRELDRAASRNLCGWLFDAEAIARTGCGRRFRNDVRFEIE